MTVAERLTRGFVSSIQESPFRIAPERAEALVAQIGCSAWSLDIVEGPVNFEAFPNDKKIEGTYSALLSLWAVAASIRLLLALMQTAAQMNLEQVVIVPGGAGYEAIALKNAALALIRDHTYAWNDAPSEPDANAVFCSEDGLTNNLFLAAASFVVLHECGHLVQNHLVHTAHRHQQEFDADRWAVAWTLDKVADENHRQFRMLAISVAFIWIGLIDEVRKTTATHPPAAQRFSNAFTQFGETGEDSLAFEISSYAIKAFFDPTTNLPQSENARDALVEQLIRYSRRE
jgi:hypothetical protein